jgi:hypothetical protein
MSAGWMTRALLGVADNAAAQVAFGEGGELGALLDQTLRAEPDAALAFGRAVGALAACRRAAVMLGESGLPALAPAEADARALPPAHAWCAPLSEVFTQGPLRVQVEACQALMRGAAHLPVAVLPAALDAGRRASAVRPALLPVLGTRGRWLARLNEDWKYAAAQVGAQAPEEADAARAREAWESGALAERQHYFRALRERDPTHARALLSAQLGELPAKERLVFVELLQTGLSAQDEPLLMPLLKDRSREVRQAAAWLLGALPESAHAARLHAWLAACLSAPPERAAPGGLRGWLSARLGSAPERGAWQCEAPSAADPDWAAAGIESKRPQHEALGERAWWLYQLARQIPLAWWCGHTGMPPEALLAWACETDWEAALLRGWRERLLWLGEKNLDQTDLAWVQALLALPGKHQLAQGNERAEMLALLPPPLRERYVPRDFNAANARQINEVVQACAPGQTLSLDFSHALLPGLLAFLAGDDLRNDYLLRAQAIDLVCALHPDSLRHGWRAPPRRDDETPAMTECLSALERIVRWRCLFSSMEPV